MQTKSTALTVQQIEKRHEGLRPGYRSKASDKRRQGQKRRQFEREIGSGANEC